MTWFSVQMNAAIIAGVVSLSITLIMVLVAIVLTNRNVRPVVHFAAAIYSWSCKV
jgi:hypothetical protein